MENCSVQISAIKSIIKPLSSLCKSLWIKCEKSGKLWISETLLRFSTSIHKPYNHVNVENRISLFTTIN